MLSSLRVRLLILVLLAVAPAAGLILYSSWEQRSNSEEKIRAETLALTQLSVSQQEQLLEGSRQVLATLAVLARGINVTTLNQETCGAGFATLLREFTSYVNFGIVAPNGDIVCSAVPLSEPVNASDRIWFQRASQEKDFAIGDYQIGRLTGVASLNFGYPILDKEGQVTAVVYLALDLEVLNRLIANEELPLGATLTIRDRRGTILAHYPDPERWVGQTIPEAPVFEAALRQGKGVAELPGLDGESRLYAYTPVGDPEKTGLYASVGLAKGSAFAEATRALNRNLVSLAVVAGLAVLAAWIGGDVFVLRRIRALVAATERLRAGNLKARTGERHDQSELGILAGSFDSMATELEAREEARAAIQTQLALRNEELEAFTYSVSHDLKEPLRTIRGYSEFLLQDYADVVEGEGKEMLEGIGAAGVRMARQIDELLSLSRLSKDASLEPLELNPLIDEIVDSLRPTIEAKGALIQVQPDLPEVMGHRARLEQILSNLLANALKFNERPGPRVEVGCDATADGTVTLFVRDNGPGIAREYHEVIFGLFQRLHRREEFDGTGAGLAIVKRAVEASGGRVWLESEVGRGTTFYFTLPAGRTASVTKAA